MEVLSLKRNQSGFSITSESWFQEIDYVGNIQIVNSSLLAVFSSTKCPASQILKVHDYAKEIRNGELGIISGFHSPAEKEVLEVLLKGTCPIVMVLGRRLENARIPKVWQGEIEKNRMLIVSPFKEYQKFVTKEISLKRNDFAAKIAKYVMIIHASAGGSLQGQVEKWNSENIKVEYLSSKSEIHLK